MTGNSKSHRPAPIPAFPRKGERCCGEQREEALVRMVAISFFADGNQTYAECF